MMLRRRSWHEFPKLWEFSQETAYGERLSFYGRPMCFSSLKRSLSRELPFNNRYNQQKLMHSKKQHTHTKSKVQPFIFENTPFTAATRCQWNGGKTTRQDHELVLQYFPTVPEVRRSEIRRKQLRFERSQWKNRHESNMWDTKLSYVVYTRYNHEPPKPWKIKVLAN